MAPRSPSVPLPSRRALLKGLAFTGAAAAAGPVLAGCDTGAGDGGTSSSGGDGPIEFLSLAWQPQSVKANKDIVAAWNKENPDLQVKYVQGDWGSVHDQMLTSFEGGDAPDIFHDSSADLADFAQQGYLADMTDLISDQFRADIPEETWKSVTFDGAVVGAPFLQESAVIYANKKLLDASDVRMPTIDEPWTWDEYEDAAKQLTDGTKVYGMAWTLKSPVRSVLNRSLSFDGMYFDIGDDGKATVVFGDAEKEAPERIHRMLWEDKSAPTRGAGMAGEDVLPGFFAGKYAMLWEGTYFRSGIIEGAPDGFEWVTLPPAVGKNQNESNEPQTLSISADSDRQEDAMKFIEFFLNPENQALLAAGDWELPASKDAWNHPPLNSGKDGWDVAESTVDDLIQAPFQQVKGFDEWQSKVAQPAMEQYFSNKISIDDLGEKLVNDGNDVLGRYQ